MNFQDYIDFANEHPTSYLATVEGDQPRVRAVLLWFADDTGFYFQTQTPKAFCKQLKKNKKVEVCFYGSWPGATGKQMMRVSGEVEFRDVSFSYDGEQPVLQEVSCRIEPGERVAIVGPSGVGKTTLVSLLLRFYEPTRGRIEVDVVDLRQIARSSWMDHVAVVTQEPFLFAGTIRDNLRYGRPDASDEDIEAAARAAHVDEFIETLPGGYETDVGDAGVMLSGGQRQRITIGRAILKDPDILIFDEATSALDAKSERYVHQAIESLLSGRTVFIIAHRLSTIRHADKIAVLKKGSIVGLGTHEELIAEEGLYRELMSVQGEEGERGSLQDPTAS